MPDVEKTTEVSYQISESMRTNFEKYSVGIDKRIELLAAVQLFTNWTETGIWKQTYPYKEDMLRYFQPYSDHKAVTLCEELITSGFSYDAPVAFMVHLSDPPELNVVTPFSEYLVNRAGDKAILEEFVEALRSFYMESDFEDFWHSHRDFYDDVETRARDYLSLESIVEALEDYFGVKQHGYHVILAPVFLGFYGARTEVNDSLDIYAVLGPIRIEGSIPVFGAALFHEFAHSFVNPLTDEFLEEYKNPWRLFYPVMEEMKSMAYGNRFTMINEHILRAAEIEMSNSMEQLSHEEKRGFIYIRPLFHLLTKYDRDSYRSFREFYPEIVDLFNSIADEYRLVVQVLNEKGEGLPNAVVSVFLPNGKGTTSKSTNSTGHLVFENMLNITYSIKASLQGYKDQTVKITFRSKDQIEMITLQSITFLETPLGIGVITGTIALLVLAIIVIKRK